MTVEQIAKNIKYWMNSAEYDLEVADSLFEKEKYNYALFFGHLSVEKILKGIYVKMTSTVAPMTHSLPLLAQRSGLAINEERMEKLAEFMEFYIEGRYPTDLQKIQQKFTQTFTSDKLEEIKEMFQWLKKKL